MTESVLLELMNRFLVERSNYCVICLRSEKERRLEKPKHLKRFMQSLDQQFIYDRPYQMVCYVCERQAASAFRFRMAAQVAAYAHTLTHQLLSKPTQQSKLSATVRSFKTKSSEEDLKTLPGWLKDMIECEIKLRKQKIVTQLLNTEVLIVSTNAKSTPRKPENVIENKTQFETAQCPRPGESKDLYVIPDEQPPTESNLNSNLVISDDEKESIIILDDDEKDKKNPMLVIDSGKICNDPPIQPKEVQTVKPIEQLYIVKPLDATDDSSMNFLLHPIVIVGNNLTIPTLASSIKNGKVLNEQNQQMDNPQIAYHDGSSLCFITDPNEVNISLQNISRFESESGKKRVNEIVRVSDGNENKSKAPQLRSDRIDWEDKIPMDVISFVDDEYSGDASKRARPMPEIGISNVTSLIEPQTDVIDLC